MRAVIKPLFVAVFRPRIVGAEHIPKEGAAVLAGNHMHALDPILIDICTHRTVRTLAKKDLRDGAFGWFFRSLGTIPVDLRAKKNPEALAAAEEALSEGELVNVSPEAKRNYTDELLLPFKYGAAAMSEKTGAALVPYAITGSYKLFGDRLTVVFGKAFHGPEGDLYRTNKQLYENIGSLLIKTMPAAVLKTKHIKEFDRWEREQNEQTS
ncbi:MAG: 1-acyl-sn-glycerol-3-phosphate acyltransferase [Ruminococcus sp.]|nr:1-acyl-sn-glycerol-3-phosphate acyltransferase [Ruminococcus sp.]